MKQFLRLYRDGEAEKSEFPIILNPTPSQVHPVKGVNTDMHGNQPLQVGNTTQGEEVNAKINSTLRKFAEGKLTPTTQSEGEEKNQAYYEKREMNYMLYMQQKAEELQALRLSNEQGDKLVIELQGNLDDQKVKIIQLEKELEELRAIRKMIPDGIWNAWKRVYSSEKELKDLKENGFSENYPDGEDFHDD